MKARIMITLDVERDGDDPQYLKNLQGERSTIEDAVADFESFLDVKIGKTVVYFDAIALDDPYEYRYTTGQRKAWDGEPDLSKEGWEEIGEWERFEYHEQREWRRLKSVAKLGAKS